jgi:orotidine-5'-phosphate decarboxylase
LASNFGQRLQAVFSSSGQLCVGLDPSAEQLGKWGLEYSANDAEKFCHQVMDACQGRVGILKPQVSFFEQFGSAGFVSLERVLSRASADGFLVIADAKRGDIGTTMDGYARAWLLNDAAFFADAVTISPFLGPESLQGFCETAIENSKGVFVLAATSNKEAAALQSASMDGNSTVAGSVAGFASRFDEAGLGSVGVVVGAQTNLEAMGIETSALASVPILAPGFGAQGASLGQAGELFGPLANNVIYSVSRSVAGDSPLGLQGRVQIAVSELESGLSI